MGQTKRKDTSGEGVHSNEIVHGRCRVVEVASGEGGRASRRAGKTAPSFSSAKQIPCSDASTTAIGGRRMETGV